MAPMSVSRADGPLEGILLDGRYLLQGPIATGGMSTVYRGLDTRLDRPVAVKVMDARYAGDQQFLTRFKLEARAAARLSDPGLVAVFDQGMDARHPYLVMELVEGGTLRELLRERGPMPPHAVVAVLRPVLRGLAVAHRGGLVHRDLKPENVLISERGEVKLADFGLVRAVAQAGITSTSVILGTAAYLSPEQVSTGDATPRSDVYSLGILTYELLTGTTPFAGDNPLAVAYMRLDQDVTPPSATIDGVPPQFDQLVARATARDAAARYADAAEMAEAVDAVTAELRLPPFRVPAPRRPVPHPSAALQTGRVDERQSVGRRQPETPPAPVSVAGGRPKPAAARRPTLAMTRGPDDWNPADISDESETSSSASHFAGISMDELAWARQRARRRTVIWLLVVVLLAVGVAAGAWQLGTNIDGLIG